MDYSLDGYLSALSMRRAKTILVEGESDRRTMSTFFTRAVDLAMCRNEIRVDSAAMIREPTAPKGNRHIVEFVHAKAQAQKLPLLGLVDREFRGFDLDQLQDTIGSHCCPTDGLFWTRGHSIECYFFVSDYIIEILCTLFPEDISQIIKDAIRDEFSQILSCSAAIAIAAAKCELVARMSDIFKWADWKGAPISLDTSRVEQALGARSVSPEIVERFGQEYRRSLSKITKSDQSFARWVSHGHIGMSAIWTGVASVAARHGTPSASVESIAYGQVVFKERLLGRAWAERALRHSDEGPLTIFQSIR